MNKKYILAIIIIAIAALGIGGYFSYKATIKPTDANALWLIPQMHLVHPDSVRGVYMTAAVAGGKWKAAIKIRNDIMELLDTTELNGLVIDVKEVHGSEVTDTMKTFVLSLFQKPVWKIARVVVFADNSQVNEHPDWYLQYSGGAIWRDSRGNAWLDPAVPEAQEYIINFSKSIIDMGFDEIQFDYIRYPSDGNVSAIDRSQKNLTRRKVISQFVKRSSDELRDYDKNIKLSVDIFGYVTQRPENSIGQALEDMAPHMDYISPMVYPSHYYSGFYVPADENRGLPTVNYGAYTANTNPGTVIHRSMLAAIDTIKSVTSTQQHAKLRPWLQNFSMGGVWYGEERVRAQIDAANQAGTQGWLLWNASNRYTRSALRADN